MYTTMSSDGITLHHCSDGEDIQSEVVVPPNVIVSGYIIRDFLMYVLYLMCYACILLGLL